MSAVSASQLLWLIAELAETLGAEVDFDISEFSAAAPINTTPAQPMTAKTFSLRERTCLR